MIWIDITDPKYALFFIHLIKYLKNQKLLITTRYSSSYKECKQILDLYDIKYHNLGSYGGSSIEDKLKARVNRELELLELFKKTGIPRVFLTGASAEGVNIAFGLKIKIILFADTPLASCKKNDFTILSRLSFPFASKIFFPFILKKKYFKLANLKKSNLHSYGFIDVAMWLGGLKKGVDFRDKFNIKKSRACILFREEEFKASYVKKKLSIIYDLIKELQNENLSLVLMPRYGTSHLKELEGIKNLTILDKSIKVQDFYPYIDLLVGGGGTMNLEASFLGVSTLSTRSLLLPHDKYLIKNNLMYHTTCLLKAKKYILQKRYLAKKPSNPSSFFIQKDLKKELTKIAEVILDS